MCPCIVQLDYVNDKFIFLLFTISDFWIVAKCTRFLAIWCKVLCVCGCLESVYYLNITKIQSIVWILSFTHKKRKGKPRSALQIVYYVPFFERMTKKELRFKFWYPFLHSFIWSSFFCKTKIGLEQKGPEQNRNAHPPLWEFGMSQNVLQIFLSGYRSRAVGRSENQGGGGGGK